MIWPEKPTSHVISPVFRISTEIYWRSPRGRDRGPYMETFRTCSYCGCIHPEDLLNALNAGATLGGSDWKYGWPHKFYVEHIPNPIAGQMVEVGWTVSNGVTTTTPTMGTAPPFVYAKWYNQHFQDDGYDNEALAALLSAVSEHSGIQWEKDERGVKFRAPHGGYQKSNLPAEA
ncbi:MAG: hypothetical protein ACYCW6_08535 [Candidatus Xenobia bacterium]